MSVHLSDSSPSTKTCTPLAPALSPPSPVTASDARRWLRVSAGLVLLFGSGSLLAAPLDAFIGGLLRREGFSTAEIQAVDADQAVVKSLETAVRAELAHFGIVHINATPATFLARFRDIERFERGPGTPQIGRFSVPPRLEDLASLTLPAKDLTALSGCSPGACDVKLSAAAIAKFRKEVNWSSPRAAARANEIFREMLLEIVRAYQATGNAALGSYDDGHESQPVAGQFRAMLDDRHPLPLAVPGLMKYLEAYPDGRPEGTEDFFYWSVVDFGLQQTLRVNHVIIYPINAGPPGASQVIAIKQVYASHYFHTTLELRFLVEDQRRGGAPGFSLISITRSRIDGTTGLKGALLRPVINRRSRSAVRGYLQHLKEQVESPDPRSFEGPGRPCAATGDLRVCVGTP